MSVSIQRPSTRILTLGTPGLSIVQPVAAAAAYDWWEASGTIAGANVLEHVESPSIRQAYAGAAVTSGNAWTIAFRGVPSTADPRDYAFDSQTGRLVFGFYDDDNGFYAGAWSDIDLWVNAEDHVHLLVSDGSNVQAYRDTSAVGSAVSSSVGIGGGTTRWLGHYNNTSISDWDGTAIAGAVFDIALNATQRSALVSAMAAL